MEPTQRSIEGLTEAIHAWAPRALPTISKEPSSEPHSYPMSLSWLLELPFGQTNGDDFLLDMLALTTGLVSGWH